MSLEVQAISRFKHTKWRQLTPCFTQYVGENYPSIHPFHYPFIFILKKKYFFHPLGGERLEGGHTFERHGLTVKKNLKSYQILCHTSTATTYLLQAPEREQFPLDDQVEYWISQLIEAVGHSQ